MEPGLGWLSSAEICCPHFREDGHQEHRPSDLSGPVPPLTSCVTSGRGRLYTSEPQRFLSNVEVTLVAAPGWLWAKMTGADASTALSWGSGAGDGLCGWRPHGPLPSHDRPSTQQWDALVVLSPHVVLRVSLFLWVSYQGRG